MLLALPAALQAQQKVTADEAVALALKNNLHIQAAKLGEQYYQSLRKSNLDFDKTNVGVEYGKINSVANDNRFTISQGIQFPTVYKHQRSINNTNITLSKLSTQQQENELKAQVKAAFYAVLVLQQKEQLLLEADSIYQAFLDKTALRFKTGDVDALEKATAENQRWQISNQLGLLKTDYAVRLNDLKILLNVADPVTPVGSDPVYHLSEIPDTGYIARTPAMALRQQLLERSIQEHKLEKSRLLPSLNLGYNNMSIIGYQRVGNDEKYFGGGDRFSSVSAGIGIPIFSIGQRSRIRAANIFIQQQERELAATRQQLELELGNAAKIYTHHLQLLGNYQSVLLSNATLVIAGANKRMAAGEIGYLEWVMLINQALEMRSNYFNVVEELNNAAFTMEKLSGLN